APGRSRSAGPGPWRPGTAGKPRGDSGDLPRLRVGRSGAVWDVVRITDAAGRVLRRGGAAGVRVPPAQHRHSHALPRFRTIREAAPAGVRAADAQPGIRFSCSIRKAAAYLSHIRLPPGRT